MQWVQKIRNWNKHKNAYRMWSSKKIGYKIIPTLQTIRSPDVEFGPVHIMQVAYIMVEAPTYELPVESSIKVDKKQQMDHRE